MQPATYASKQNVLKSTSLFPIVWGSETGPGNLQVEDRYLGQPHLVDDPMLSHVSARHGVRISENSLPFHTITRDSGQLYYLSEPQYLIPSTAGDNLDYTYVWSNADFPWFDFGEVTSQMESTEPSLATKPSEMSSQFSALGTYHICHWVENDVHCGQIISDAIHGLSSHLRDAHDVQGNEKRMLVCRWLDCGQKLQRGVLQGIFSPRCNEEAC